MLGSKELQRHHTFRASGKTAYGISNEVKEEPKVEACFIDPATGQKECE